MAEQKTMLIVGALGVIGRSLVQYLADLDDWRVIGLSRRRPDRDIEQKGTFISVDLLNPEDCQNKLRDLHNVTHIVYAALQDRPRPEEQVIPNLTMLQNVIETIEAASPRLERVVLMEGVKYYGVHLGPFKTPAKESDPRHMPPNFYYDQEDYLKERQQGKSWTWTVLRPDVVCGLASGNPMNLSMLIAVYAAFSKELGLPLRFPGAAGAYSALAQVTDATHLAKATVWAAITPQCANEAFNITNGDYFRWQQLWPRFASFFGMEYASPQHISLAQVMRDKGPLWDRIVQKYHLTGISYQNVAAWPFGDFVFGCTYDVMSDTTKIRRFGFHDVVESEEMFIRWFETFRKHKIIP